jgi:hypothetical protein
MKKRNGYFNVVFIIVVDVDVDVDVVIVIVFRSWFLTLSIIKFVNVLH